MTPVPHNKNLLFVCVVILALIAFLFYRDNQIALEKINQEELRDQRMSEALANTEVLAQSFSAYSVSRHKKIYGKNDEVQMPIASITKIMTTVVALNAYPPDTTITLSMNAIKQAGDFTLTAGENWNVRDLAKLTLISSANDGAYALWENYPNGGAGFLPEMNARARRLGMLNTNFQNIMGLDVAGQATAFSSAEDVNLMSAYAYLAYPDVFQVTTLPEISLTSAMGTTHIFKNTNTITAKIPNLIFSKTGYTDIAQGNLAIIFKNSDGELIAVTLLGSTYEGRFADMEKIVNSLYGV